MRPALVFVAHTGKPIPPRIRLGKGVGPEFVRRGDARDRSLRPGPHVDPVDTVPVGGDRIPHRQLARIMLRLTNPQRHLFASRLRFDHAQLHVPVLQHIVRLHRTRPSPAPLNAPGTDLILPTDPAPIHHTPARRAQRGVDQLGAGFSFVHPFMMLWPAL